MMELEPQQRFWTHLGDGLSAGSPLLACLRDCATELRDDPFATVVGELADELAAGGMLSAAMAARPAWFGTGAVKMVEGGELLGVLDRAARMVAEFAAECPNCVAWRGLG